MIAAWAITRAAHPKNVLRREVTVTRHSAIRMVAAAVFCFTAVSEASANSGVPAPLIIMGAFDAVRPLQWIAATMFMCIGIEGAIYHYSGRLARPYLMSGVANFVSLALGWVLALHVLGLLDRLKWHSSGGLLIAILLPTATGVAVETGLLFPFRTAKPRRGRFVATVVCANVVTNALLVVYAWIGYSVKG